MNVNVQDSRGRTPLALSCKGGDLQLTQTLLSAGADPNLADMHQETPLMKAARFTHDSIVELLLHRQDCDSERQDCNGMTALAHIAFASAGATTAQGTSRCQKILTKLCQVADISSCDHSGATPLINAAVAGSLCAVEILCNTKIGKSCIDVQDRFGLTAVMRAVRHTPPKVEKQIVDCLLRAGADVLIEDRFGATVVQAAASHRGVQFEVCCRNLLCLCVFSSETLAMSALLFSAKI